VIHTRSNILNDMARSAADHHGGLWNRNLAGRDLSGFNYPNELKMEVCEHLEREKSKLPWPQGERLLTQCNYETDDNEKE
jgi:hypothetical protein